MNEVSRLLADDEKAKRKARGGQAVAKKEPRRVITPADFAHYPRAWGLVAPPIVHVIVETGDVTVFRWPYQCLKKRRGHHVGTGD